MDSWWKHMKIYITTKGIDRRETTINQIMDIDTGIMLYSSKTNMSGNNSGDIKCTDGKLKDIFVAKIVIMESFKFWK